MTAPHRTGPPEVLCGGADRHQKLPEPMVMEGIPYYGTGRFIKFIGRTKALVVDSACCIVRVAGD
ncbi:MAG TPA: hypothetical protein VFM74_01660, partial [Candidatus Limnocylindria bacterium]|nr:hypothetical protein [Candidatus Limnocylindria bacterium]